MCTLLAVRIRELRSVQQSERQVCVGLVHVLEASQFLRKLHAVRCHRQATTQHFAYSCADLLRSHRQRSRSPLLSSALRGPSRARQQQTSQACMLHAGHSLLYAITDCSSAHLAMHADVHRFTNVYNAPAASFALPSAALHIRRLYANVFITIQPDP